uniref:Probable prolyl 4-hydroxylase 10 n=1 Tax=Tanacetum cinerariifolium TaxID=118510 RepID=A0A6L2JP61_TANCI|nr:probable prolyl 4-hydroxylase 10 [Tanacetum cinerariifolium]
MDDSGDVAINQKKVICARNKLYEHFVMASAAEWKKDQVTFKRIHDSNASTILYSLKPKKDEYEVMLSIYLTPISYNLKANTKALYKLEEEREHLINIAKPYTENSTVVDSVTGKSKNSRVCTSSGKFLDRGQDESVQAIEKRISDFTFLHVDVEEGGETVFPSSKGNFSTVPWWNGLSNVAKKGYLLSQK